MSVRHHRAAPQREAERVTEGLRVALPAPLGELERELERVREEQPEDERVTVGHWSGSIGALMLPSNIQNSLKKLTIYFGKTHLKETSIV